MSLNREEKKEYSTLYLELIQRSDRQSMELADKLPQNLTEVEDIHYNILKRFMGAARSRASLADKAIRVISDPKFRRDPGLNSIHRKLQSGRELSPSEKVEIEQAYAESMGIPPQVADLASLPHALQQTPQAPQAPQAPQQQILNPASQSVLQRIDALLKKNPRSSFLQNIRSWAAKGKRLSPKQMAALQNMENPTVDTKLLKRIDALLQNRRSSRFLKSLRDQVAAGRKLSQKQLDAIQENELKLNSGSNPVETKFLQANDAGKAQMLLNQNAWMQMENSSYIDLPDLILDNFIDWGLGRPISPKAKGMIKARLKMKYHNHPILSQLKDPMGAIDNLK